MKHIIMNQNDKKYIKGFRVKTVEDARKKRGKAQRIFLIMTHEHNSDVLERKYEVMGTTGNAYAVTVKNIPTCTCPDHTLRNKRCKHIYFVLTRIMKVEPDQEDIDEYSDQDLRDMFKNIPPIVDNLKVDNIRLAKFKALNKNSNGEVDIKKIDQDDLCPVCLGEMYDRDEELIYCKYSCGNGIHKECFDQYSSKQHDIKCLFCHKKWITKNNQYINIE
jgi:hypothetical protein